MSKSLVELRQSSRVGLPERSYQLCLAPKLVAEVQALVSQLEDAQIAAEAQREGDEGAAKPKRLGEKFEVVEIRTRLAGLQQEMADHTGTLTLRGMTEGAWRLWVDEHPARKDNERDEALAYGMCNADALIDSMESFAHAWNGEPLGAGDWDFLRDNAAAGDIKAIAQLVVAMHETVVNIPKLLSSSLGILADASD